MSASEQAAYFRGTVDEYLGFEAHCDLDGVHEVVGAIQ
jgi:hypothetical protein